MRRGGSGRIGPLPPTLRSHEVRAREVQSGMRHRSLAGSTRTSLATAALAAQVLFLRASVVSADVPTECGGTEAQDYGAVTFTRYIPNPAVAPNGSRNIQFTYSSLFLSDAYNNNQQALESDLDAFAAKLCDEIDNPMGVPKPDLALIHDVFQSTDYRPYEYGDPWFSLPENGGGDFLVDQGLRYDHDVRGVQNGLGPPAAYNHIDIVFVTSGNPSYTESTNGVSDAGEDPEHPTRTFRENGTTLRTVPKAPTWGVGYAVAAHELGHLFDFTTFGSAIGSRREGFGQEPRAQITRRYVGIDVPEHGGYGTPYNKCYYRDVEGDPTRGAGPEPAAWDYGGGRGDDLGEIFWAYLAEHFDGGTTTTVVDDLASEYLTQTSFKTDGTRFANTYFWTLARLLEAAHYDDVTRYPYFSEAGVPLSGDERLATLWHNLSIAVGINAPALSVGEYGFPFQFRPTFQWQTFTPVDYGHYDAEVPGTTTVSASDYGITRTQESPYTMTDGSLYQLEVHPWNMEMWVFNVDGTADPDARRQVRIRVLGDGVPYGDPPANYFHDVKATLVTFADLEGGWIHESPGKVMGLEHLDGVIQGGNLTFSGTIPTYVGARHGLLVLSMAEENMPEFMDPTHPLYQQPYQPWGFALEYTLEDAALPVLENKSVETQLNYAGAPYSSVAFDYDGDGHLDLMIANRTALSTLHQRISETDGVPQFQQAFPGTFATGQAPQVGLRGLTVADVDNDGDLDLFAAAASDARLYRNDGNSPRTFTDIAPATGLSGANGFANDSWTGCWGDYNRDGQVDLFVGRGLAAFEPDPSGVSALPDRLLRNDLLASGTFADVSQVAGIDQVVEEQDCTVGASWADFDGDGDLDLFAGRLKDPLTGGEPGGPHVGSHLYVNQFVPSGFFTFLEESDSWLPENLVLTSAATWCDMDGDADLDLVASAQYPGWVGTRIYLKQGSSFSYVSESVGAGDREPVIGVFPLDQDLDGRMDLLAVPESSTRRPWLYTGVAGAPRFVLFDRAAGLGLQPAPTSGAALADYNGDGDIDLFLGRAVDGANSKFFYRARMAGGGDAPSNHWVGIKLVGGGGNNKAAIGTVVNLKIDGVAVSTQVVDGGSSRGGQRALTLTFGLGAASSGVSAEVRWPDGLVQSHPLTVNSVNTITDQTTQPTVLQTTVSATYAPEGPSLSTWTFTWESPYGTRQSLERVTVWNAPGSPGQCYIGTLQFKPGDPGVSYTYSAKPGGGYVHTVVVYGQPCEPGCTYRYTVTSGTDFRSTTSNYKTFRTMICAQ
jgi:hypothetical protein